MKKLLFTPFILACFLLVTELQAQGVVTTPRTPSPAASVSQTIGISNVTVEYSRPSVRDREIWGALVPYGWNTQGFGAGNSAPWRAGANENTVITFSHDAVVEGEEVPAGSYGLFFVIDEDNTGEVVLSTDYRSWGSYWYDPANDLLRADIEIRDIPMTEILTYDFINLDKNSAELVLNWEKKQFPVKIEFDVDEIVLANAAEELKGATGFAWQGYASAANYALQNKAGLEQGLKWIETALQQNKNFTNLRIKSGILAEMGEKEKADEIMAEALPTATEAELNMYGYQLMGNGDIDKAIEVFTINTEKHPKSANVWDSLGEAYVQKGEEKKAIKNFKKSLSLNPPPNVKANSEKHLKQLGAM